MHKAMHKAGTHTRERDKEQPTKERLSISHGIDILQNSFLQEQK
jgi:hypothetical protein